MANHWRGPPCARAWHCHCERVSAFFDIYNYILSFHFFLLALNHSHAHVSHANPRSSRLHVSAASCHHGERAGGHQGSGKQLAAVACPSRHHGERTRGHEGTCAQGRYVHLSDVSAASCHHSERAGGHQGAGKQLAADARTGRHHGERSRGHERTCAQGRGTHTCQTSPPPAAIMV